ncbi:hypothetical protein HQQ80_11685 [Microbacteriaceae bacterium VKM Ac-2855]|nr:hypothetical protein [Microbacteriaceae bacterium VKM Ac-2855]
MGWEGFEADALGRLTLLRRDADGTVLAIATVAAGEGLLDGSVVGSRPIESEPSGLGPGARAVADWVRVGPSGDAGEPEQIAERCRVLFERQGRMIGVQLVCVDLGLLQSVSSAAETLARTVRIEQGVSA